MVKIPVTELRRPRLGYSAIDRSWLLEQPPHGPGAAVPPDHWKSASPVPLPTHSEWRAAIAKSVRKSGADHRATMTMWAGSWSGHYVRG